MENHSLDKGSFWIIVVATIVFLIASFYDYYALHWTFYTSPLFFYLGIILLVIGYALRMYSRITLREQFSVFVALQKEHKLITTGIYAHIRHPIYTAGILSFLGFVLIANTLLGLLLGIFLVFPALLYRISVEEKMLVAHFGQQYLEYKQNVKALIPGVL